MNKKPSMQQYQEIELQNITETGASSTLAEPKQFEYLIDGIWLDLKPGMTLYDISVMGFEVRRKKVAEIDLK